MKRKLNYWLNRIKNRINLFTADAEKIADELGKAYFKASQRLETEVKKVFKGFQNAFKLSEAEAKELLKKTDGKVPSKAVREAVSKITDPDTKRQMEAAMSAPAYQYRMKRLDEIAENGEKVCEELAKGEIKTTRTFLRKETEKAYNHTIYDIQQGTGVSGSFTQIPKSRIEQVLKENWSGKHFSERIWGNTQELAEELKQSLCESFLTGESEQKAAARLQERFGVKAFEARRLIRTENTYVCGQAELEAYKESGVKHYEYAALIDDRTSKICRHLDGKIFSVGEAEPGKNYPPMHPFCRSSSLAVLPTVEELRKKEAELYVFFAERIPEGMTFDEWLDRLEPTEDGKLVYTGKSGKSVDKSAESGIIKVKEARELEQAKKRDHKIYVTDVAIDKVDKVSLSDFTEEQISAMQRKHKELLRIAKNENDSNEVLLINDLEFKSEVSVLGGEFKVSPGENPFAVSVVSNAKRQSLIYLHNHPSTNNFSVGDIDTFVCESAIKTISVVTNQGEVYVLNKTAAYNYNNIRALLNDIYKSFDGDEIDNKAFVSEFLKRCKEGGVEYGKAK